GTAAPRGDRTREEGRGGTEGVEGGARPRGPPPRECLRRIPRMRERLRGDRTPSRRGGRSPAPRGRRDPPAGWGPLRRGPVPAVRPERDRRRRGPGGREMEKVGVSGAGMTLARRRLRGAGQGVCC